MDMHKVEEYRCANCGKVEYRNDNWRLCNNPYRKVSFFVCSDKCNLEYLKKWLDQNPRR